MNHNLIFKEWLVNRLNSALPGEESQYNLAPFKRKEEATIAWNNDKKPRLSAVMLILYPEDGMIHVPLIIRNVYDGVHSGQIGLPGGKNEYFDQNIQQTAIRETIEEISVHVNEKDILGSLSELYVPVSNFIIQPFIAWLDHKPEFTRDPSEVQKILEVPLAHLQNPAHVQERTIKTRDGYSIKAPGIPIEDEFLWGATAMIVSEFIAILQEFK
jgi:8-oxo-dGTP pyrophosphatase MutT (NUDIX family)